MRFHLARYEDLPAILSIIHEAQAFLKTQNSGQWQDGYPTEGILQNDINQQRLYVARNGNDVCGVCAVLNYDPDYSSLTSGSWIIKVPYLVIHRFAVSDKYRRSGVGKYMLSETEKLAKRQQIIDIKVDTHEKNVPMISLLLKSGFEKRGEVLLEQTKQRVVFEKVLK
ncbi:MAG: GNAT family N-acetyltransferase [Firmicutes bacterium]|nr:GNAT family N-acetyltransferase [Bacillota bacterium]